MRASATAEPASPAAPAKNALSSPEHTGSLRWGWIAWGLGALCYFTSLFHRASLGVAAGEAMQRFHAGPALLALLSALQLGVYLVLQVPSGLLADRLGPRKVITGGMLALAAGSLVFGVSSSVAGGVTGRVLIGVGDAFMFINVLRLAAHWFPPARYGRIAALTGLTGGLGQLVATVPLSGALHGLGWTVIFGAAGTITAVIAVLAAVVVRDGPAGEHAEPEPAREPVRQALRGVVAKRGTRHSFFVHFVLMAQFVAVTTLWGSPWLTQAQGRSASVASSMLLLCVVGFIVGSWLCGQYVAGRPARRERFTAWVSVGVVAVWSVMVAWPGPLPTPVLLAVLVAIGAAGGGSMLSFDGARAANSKHRNGTASGVVNMGGFLAAVLVQVLVGVVLQVTGSLPAGEAYRWAFAPVVLLLVVGTVAQVRLRTVR